MHYNSYIATVITLMCPDKFQLKCYSMGCSVGWEISPKEITGSFKGTLTKFNSIGSLARTFMGKGGIWRREMKSRRWQGEKGWEE